LGRTTCKTIVRKEWAPLDLVLMDIEKKLDTNPDYITLSGSGEPTLFSRIGELIAHIRRLTNIPIAVLTNGSLLWQKEVRDPLLQADLVIPSLDAGDEIMFQAVNRPHHEITHETMLTGIIEFRQEFRGQLWLEIFVLAGHTAVESELLKLKRCAERIRPDRVQLNTVTRPPAEYFADSVSRARLEQIAAIFDPPAEVIADYRKIYERKEFVTNRKDILNLLERRPCSVDDIVNGLGMNRHETLKHMEELIKENLVVHSFINGKLFYKTHNQFLLSSNACEKTTV
jgi:wyosine [tRNA(Phe)-imidazoG37] synthetase (radical SAM superfamily)